jgi:hypothetical protein
LTKVFNLIEERNFWIIDGCHSFGAWCSDHFLDSVNLSRDRAMNMPFVGGQLYGFDFTDKLVVEVLMNGMV